MPTQKCLRGHDQAVTAPWWEHPSKRGEEGTIRRLQRWTAGLPGEYDELMSQDEQLDVLCELAAPASEKQPQNGREDEIGERKEHPPMLPEPCTCGSATAT